MVFIKYNICLLLLWWLEDCPGLICNIFYRYGNLGGGKSSSTYYIIITLECVVQLVNGVGSRVCGVSGCTSSTHNSVCLSVGPASETPKIIHYRVVLFHTPDICLIDL